MGAVVVLEDSATKAFNFISEMQMLAPRAHADDFNTHLHAVRELLGLELRGEKRRRLGAFGTYEGRSFHGGSQG